MRNLPILFFLTCYLLGKSQIKDVSIYYSATHRSKVYNLLSLQDIYIQTTFTSKHKLNFGVFAFYGANQESGNGHWLYVPTVTQKMGEVTLKYSYQGSPGGTWHGFLL